MLGYRLIKEKDYQLLKNGFNSSLDMYILASERNKADAEIINISTNALWKILNMYPHIFQECVTKEEIERMVVLNNKV